VHLPDEALLALPASAPAPTMTEPASGTAYESLPAPTADVTPDVIDGIALARLYGEPLFKLPEDLYIPPHALEVFLEAF